MGLVADFIATRPNEDQLIVIDPVMGDNGSTYGPITGRWWNTCEVTSMTRTSSPQT